MFLLLVGRVPCTRTEPDVRTCARARTEPTATAWTGHARAVRAGWAPAVHSPANRANMAETAGTVQYGTILLKACTCTVSYHLFQVHFFCWHFKLL